MDTSAAIPIDITLTGLQEVALCHGWVDNLGQRIDDERWALRFTPDGPQRTGRR